MSNNYWKSFWNNNPIINFKDPQLKVGRSINGVAISEDLWNETLMFIEKQLELKDNDILLDIGAGSGMLSIPFSEKVKQIFALDISEKLMDNIQKSNIQKWVGDARVFDFKPNQFTKIINYFALQHFTLEETVLLFKKIYSCLIEEGIAYIGDIPNINKQFEFHRKPAWKVAYFQSLEHKKPIIGTWFTKEFCENLGEYCGFSKIKIINQPKHFINAFYRFDLKLVK